MLRRAFTLVEMMVAMAVLSLILVMLAEMMNMMAMVTTLSNHQMDATQTTRLVLDGLDKDFSTLISQYGAALCVPPSQNDPAISTPIAFLSATRGPAEPSSPNYPLPDSTYRCMGLTYTLDGNQVTRHADPITWNQTNPMMELLGNSANMSAPTSTSQLGNNILALQAVVSLDNGHTYPVGSSKYALPLSASTNAINGQALPAGWVALVVSKSPIDSNNPRVTAITIALAALDSQTIKIHGASNISASLGAPTQDQTPIDAWNNADLSQYPKPAVAALHFAQRTFSLK